MTNAEDYLQLQWTIELVHDRDEDGNAGWVAEVIELPGCISQGSSADEAVSKVYDAMLGWISVALEDGRSIPEPRAHIRHSGRLLLRMPRTLHAQLAREAEVEGVSLNQFVTASLAGSVGWRHAEHSGALPA